MQVTFDSVQVTFHSIPAQEHVEFGPKLDTQDQKHYDTSKSK